MIRRSISRLGFVDMFTGYWFYKKTDLLNDDDKNAKCHKHRICILVDISRADWKTCLCEKSITLIFYDRQGSWTCQGIPETVIFYSGSTEFAKTNQGNDTRFVWFLYFLKL